MQKPIFRKTALERLSSPEQIDQLMPVTSLRGWLALLGLLMLIAALFVWSVVDRVPIQVSGQGILMHGGQLAIVSAPESGLLETLLVRPGDHVESGRTIAGIRPHSSIAAPPIAVRSLVDGHVVEVLAGPGSVVRAGELLVTLEDATQPLEAIIYVPAAEGGKLRAGMAAEVSPQHIDRMRYGVLRGVVRSVAAFPASTRSMEVTLINDRLIRELSAGGGLIEVRVALQTDASGAYSWSASSPPPDSIQGGALCTVRFTIAERRPIELLLPPR